jgi:hypothetical protein
MTRRLIATVLAAAMALTSFNVGTAQATDRDTARFIAGAAALAIIGSAFAAEQRRKATPTHSTQSPRYNQQYKRPNHQYNRRNEHRQNNKKRARPAVARQCLSNVRGHNGWTQGYGVSCAKKNTRAALPSDCVRRNYANGPRLYYAPSCLRQRGFNA